MNGLEMRAKRAAVEVYETPTEQFGLVTSTPIEGLTNEEFAALRQEQNRQKVTGDLTPYFQPGEEIPTEVAASFGGSTIPKLMGTCTYDNSSPMNVFRQKLGIEEFVVTPSLQKAFDAGHFLEFPIAEEFCRRHYLTLLKPTGLLSLNTNPAVFCNPDFYARDEETGEVYVLEIKNPNGRLRQAEVHRRYDNGLPAEQMYIDQNLYQMYVTGIHKGYIVYGWCESPYAVDNNEIDSVYGFEVEYDEERVHQMLAAVEIAKRALVEVDEKLLLRLPGSTSKDFTIVYGEGEGEIVTDDQEWKDACDLYCSAIRRRDMAKEEAEEAEEKLRKLLADKKRAIVHNDLKDVFISTKTRESKTWDEEKLQQIDKEFYQQHVSFSITDAQLKKVPEDKKEEILSCRTVTTKAVDGVKIEIKNNK